MGIRGDLSGDDRGLIGVALAGLVVVLGVIGLLVMLSATSSHQGAVRHYQSAKAFYLAEGALEFGIGYLTQYPDSLVGFSRTGVAPGGQWEVTASSRLRARGIVGETQRLVSLAILSKYKAIYAKGGITKDGHDNPTVTPLDEDGNPVDPPPVGGDSLPPGIQDTLLTSLASDQGHTISGNFKPADGYPNGSFYYSGDVPNVTHVGGDLKVSGNGTVYGIFVVEGNVELKGDARVVGVIYLPNPGSTVIRGGGSPWESSVTGAIVTAGSVEGKGKFGPKTDITVRLHTEYLEAFLSESGALDTFKERLEFDTWRED